MAEKSSDDVVRDALERFEDSVEGSEHNREAYYEDFKFARLADQWPDAIKKQRVQEGRPVLVINKLPALIRAVVNESRQNRPSIKVSPVDSGADEDTAEVIGGLVRSIERNSNAEVAYNTALDQAVTGGFGFFRVCIDFANEETFDMEARIDRIPNALQVHYDPTTTEFDASDWEFAFVSEMMNEREYKRLYPDASMVAFDGDSRNGSWVDDEDIRVAEYFLRTLSTRTLVQFQTGQGIQVYREEELPQAAEMFFEAGGIDPSGGSDEEMIQAFVQMSGMTEMARREAEYHTVTRRIMNGVEVLSEDEWPGPTIPICPVWGDEVYIDGRRHFRSMIRDAKDPQSIFNFWRSATTELVGLAPKTPWVGPKGFIPKGQEAKWASANTRSHAYLEYEDMGKNPPRRTDFAGVPSGALQEALNANDDMKAITGIYDPSLGAESPEKSGVAIRARQTQGDISNFHFLGNLSRAIRYCGQVLVDIIPAVYSARETVRILGEDRAQQVIKLTQEAGGAEGDELYNLSVGRYDVTVATGPTFATQREETRDTLIEIMRQVPDAGPFIGDVLMDHMDFVGADKVAKRLKALLPQAIRDAEDAEANSDDPEKAALQQKLQAMQQTMEQAQQAVMAEIQKLQQENEALKADGQAKVAEVQAKQAEVQLKARELVLKEAAADAAPTVEEQWSYDRQIDADKRQFEAEQNALDRQTKVELKREELGIKIQEIDEGRSARRDGMAEQGILNSDQLDEDRALAAQAVQAAQDGQKAIVGDLVAVMAAPKRILRDSQGRPVGVETITTDETLVGCDDITAVMAAPKRIVWDSQGRPAGVETVVAE
jgi:hypothetical protein